MKNIFLICGLLILFSAPRKSFAQYEKFKALYIYNFTKRIDWPEEQKKGNFVMGVLGKGAIVKHLKDFTENRKVINQEIAVKQFDDLSQLDSCHLLFITAKHKDQIPFIVNQYADAPMLIVSEVSGSEACINFRETEKALLFEINATRIRNKNLKVSQSLINLGIEINNGT